MYRCRKPAQILPLRNEIIFRILPLFLVFVCATRAVRSQTKRYTGFVLSAPVGSETAVRFFYYSGGDVVDGPLVFRPVENESSRANTTDILFDEMARLTEGLAQLNLAWKESKKIEKLRPFSIYDEPSVKVDIEVVSSAGTAKAKLDGSLACEKLAALDSAFQTRRALLEFQEFRFQMDCSVSGFNHLEYMQMIVRERTPKQQGSSPK
jgi:hypothetical protein